MAKSKLNSTETLISEALIDMEMSHEEFTANLREKNKYEKMKGNLKWKWRICIKLGDCVVRVKDTSCKAMYKIKNLKQLM